MKPVIKKRYLKALLIFLKSFNFNLLACDSSEEKQIDFIISQDLKKLDFMLSNNQINIDWADSYGLTALIYAVRSNNKEKTDFLIERGANPNFRSKVGSNYYHPNFGLLTDGSTALMHFLDSGNSGNIYILYKLLDAGAEVNCFLKDGKPLAFLAIYNIYYLKEILNRFPELINLVCPISGNSLATHVVNNLVMYLPILNFLIEKNIDLNTKNKEGLTVLHYLLNFFNDIPEGVIDNTDPNIKTSDNETFLLFLLKKNKPFAGLRLQGNSVNNRLIDFLFQANIDEQTNLKKETALMRAVKTNFLYIVRILLSKNVNKSLTNYRGLTALDIAKKLNKHTLIETLEEGINN